MKYTIEIWPIIKLINLYEDDKLNLNPPYQRNAIWSENAQKLLIDTIKNEFPIPVFFLQEKSKGFYDMVDGQQRTRAILGYIRKFITDKNGKDFKKGDFDNYDVPICILSNQLSVENVREFYVRVNKTGLKLERPELNKAEFFDTTFLKLVSEITELKEFTDLGLFRKSDIKRMFDRDFVEELVAQLLYGITDKKKTVDIIFKSDIDQNEYLEIKSKFERILKKISMLNEHFPLNECRYSQKNDFYTFFGLISQLIDLTDEDLKYFYNVLITIEKGIKPSNEDCDPLQEYAINCVTQSNSKNARKRRIEILEKILLNKSERPNLIQRKVSKYFTGKVSKLKQIDNYFTLDLNSF